MPDQYEVLAWEDPPEPVEPITTRGGKWAIVGEQCANKPGTWAKTKASLWNPSTHMIMKSLKKSHPEWEYEVRIVPHFDDRGIRQRSTVYVRCIGAA